MVRDLSLEVNAQLRVLGDPNAPHLPVTIASFDQQSLSITGAPLLPLNAPVKILQADRLVLGLVMESRSNGSATIKIIHLLDNLGELARLAAEFSSPAPARREHEPTLS